MRAGQLRHRIAIQTKTEVSDGMGGMTVTWPEKDWYKVWASVWPLRGEEPIEAMRLEGKVSHRIKIRYGAKVASLLSTLPTAKRIYLIKEDRYFRILSVLKPVERNIFFDIMVEEEV